MSSRRPPPPPKSALAKSMSKSSKLNAPPDHVKQVSVSNDGDNYDNYNDYYGNEFKGSELVSTNSLPPPVPESAQTGNTFSNGEKAAAVNARYQDDYVFKKQESIDSNDGKSRPKLVFVALIIAIIALIIAIVSTVMVAQRTKERIDTLENDALALQR